MRLRNAKKKCKTKRYRKKVTYPRAEQLLLEELVSRDAGVEATRRAGVAGSGGGRSDGVSDGHGTRVPDSSTSKLQDLIALDSEMVPDILLLDSMDAHAKRKKMQN
jgi:hypothetical protein